ncbi:MAG: CPBP family intramembrane glutamic endopeptidase [Acutalibacter sp.]|jgi:membrane protease YdiL (CAAX protease family)
MTVRKTMGIWGRGAGLLAGLQLLRIGFKSLVFTFLPRTISADIVCSCVYMAAMTVFLLGWWRHQGEFLSLLPRRFGKGYLAAAILAGAFLVSTPLITRNTSFQALLSLVYGAVVTVTFEEVLFRGWVWQKLCSLGKGALPWLGSSVLFGLWHLGYADTVLWRTSLFSPSADVVTILFWKVVTGLLLGLGFGLLRWKLGNVFAPGLAHLVINAFGS